MLDLNKENYISWNVKSTIKILERDYYAYRVVLKYEDGSSVTQQKSGFKTKKLAEEARKVTMGELAAGTYIVNSRVRVDEFFEYWLEEDIRKRVGSANTYATYANIVHRHIFPFWKKKLIKELDIGDVQRLYNERTQYSVHIARQVKTVLNVAFGYAVAHKLIVTNPAKGVNLPKTVSATPYHTRTIDTQKTLTMDQIKMLIEASKDTPIRMQILFNVLMGLRRQEINGVKYSDVDYVNRTLSVERQLGKKLVRNPDECDEKPTTKNELHLKTTSSKRLLPIPDLVFEAILEERKKYEKNRKRRINDKHNPFMDADYICCSSYGKPRSKDFHFTHYKELLHKLGLPDIRWHDLRATYCTLLLKEDFSPKAVSQLMGHAKEIITLDVYGDNQNIIPDEIPELIAFMDDVLPKQEEPVTDKTVDIEINIEEYFTV